MTCLFCTSFHNGLKIQLDSEEVNVDLFLRFVLGEKSRWVSFNNLPSLPARFGNRTWIDSNAEPHNCFKLSGCTCDDWDKGGKCDHVVPTKGNGLVFQNMCKEDSSKIEEWRTRPPLPSPRTFTPTPLMRVYETSCAF